MHVQVCGLCVCERVHGVCTCTCVRCFYNYTHCSACVGVHVHMCEVLAYHTHCMRTLHAYLLQAPACRTPGSWCGNIVSPFVGCLHCTHRIPSAHIYALYACAHKQVRNNPPFVGCLDYIFLSQGCTASELRPLPDSLPDFAALAEAIASASQQADTVVASSSEAVTEIVANTSETDSGSSPAPEETSSAIRNREEEVIVLDPELLIDPSVLQWLGPFPNADNPSDHLMVAATVTLPE
jgi:hypothetical protein